MKKAEMGIGTLIVFITFIIIAAVAVGVLISNTSTLQNKAITTGKAAAEEVGTSMQNGEIYAIDGSSGDSVDYFYNTIKLSSGSEPLKFTSNYILFTVSLNNDSKEYTYDGNNTNGESFINCSVDPITSNASDSLANSTNEGKFGIQYLMQGEQYTPGYLSDGDVVKICFKSPRAVITQEEMRFTYLPKTGSPLRLKILTPSIMSEKRVYLYP